MDGPNSQSALSDLLGLFAKFHVPLTSLRFVSNDGNYSVFDDFGPSSLVEVFSCLPCLEVLCVDHDGNDDHSLEDAERMPWPGAWVSVTSVTCSERH